MIRTEILNISTVNEPPSRVHESLKLHAEISVIRCAWCVYVCKSVHFFRVKVHSFQLIPRGVRDPKSLKITSRNVSTFFSWNLIVHKDRNPIRSYKHAYNTELQVCLILCSAPILRECIFHYCEMNQPKESKAQEALLPVRLWKVLEQVRSYVSFFISCIWLPGKIVWNRAQALKSRKVESDWNL